MIRFPLAFWLCLVSYANGFAQEWPSRPVRIVVAAPAGGNIDLGARVIAEQLQKEFQQPFLVVNRGGAGGMLAADQAAKSTPDGYTFLFTSGILIFSPLMFNSPPYDWKKDFIPVSSLTFTPIVAESHPSLPVNSLTDLLSLAKERGSSLTMGTVIGGTPHMAGEYVQLKTGLRWTTVTYRGNMAATTDLLGGIVNFQFDTLSTSLSLIQSGKLKPLAVASEHRVPTLPDVPTMKESGFPDFVAETFTGLFAPTGTPSEVINKVAATIRRTVASPEIQQRSSSTGAEAKAVQLSEFRDYLNNEEAKWSSVIKQANIRGE